MIKDETPLVSIIVPAYNVVDYIEECIISLLNQTYDNIEIIVIDDGSTDGTCLVCNRFRDDRVKVIHKSNGGLVAARKSGLSIAMGKYVGFVDGDDYVASDFVKNLVTAIENNHVDFVHASFCEVDGNDVKICAGGFNGEFVFDDSDSRENFLKEYVFSDASDKWITSSIWSKLFKKKFIQDCYELVPNRQNYGEDLICLIYCIMKCRSMSVIENSDYRYRIREISMSHLDNKNLFFKELELCNTIKNIGITDENDRLKECIYDFIRNKIKTMWNRTATYYYCEEEKLRNKSIVIYGAGRVGQDYYGHLKEVCRDIYIVDRDYENKDGEVYSIDKLSELFYDYILIAIEKREIVDEVKKQLMQRNVGCEKIIWMPPEKR